MTTFSRKKIRGFDRKLKQLDDWKYFILSFPPEKLTKTSGQIFRINLNPFTWYGDKNPNIKFHKYIFKTYADILQRLKDSEVVKNNKLTVQLWLFYPRTIKSLVIVVPKEVYIKRNDQIKAAETKLIPPKIILQAFTNQKWKIGEDNTFEPVDPSSDDTAWVTHKLGDIWITE